MKFHFKRLRKLFSKNKLIVVPVSAVVTIGIAGTVYAVTSSTHNERNKNIETQVSAPVKSKKTVEDMPSSNIPTVDAPVQTTTTVPPQSSAAVSPTQSPAAKPTAPSSKPKSSLKAYTEYLSQSNSE